jgi:two-component system, cell cycle sensor histidine kinase and response regulator CckA
VAPLSTVDPHAAMQELQIYRAELELQNEELRAGRALLEETQKRYFRHFDLAPVGLVRLSSRGMVLEANILGAGMLGVNRAQLGRSPRPFLTRVAAGSRAAFQQHLEQALASGQMEACDLTLRAANGAEAFVRMQSVRSPGEGETPELYVTLTDLTERRRIEQALQESEARTGAEREHLTEVLESISDIFYALDADWRFTYVNRKAEEVWGRRREDLLGRPYGNEFPAALDRESYDMHLKAMTERRAVHYETVSPVLRRWIGVSIYPRRGGGLCVYFRDISERKRTEEALRQSEERFRLIVESARDYAIFTLDADRRVTSWNPGAETILGYTEEAIRGQSGEVIFTAEDRAAGQPQLEWATALREGHADDERWHVRRDGSRFWATGVMMRLREASGAAPGCLKIMRDLTAVHQAEAARRQAEERFRLLAQSVRDYAIFLLDPQGRVTHWNEGAARIKGYTEGEILGQHCSIFYPPQAVAAGVPERQLREAVADGRSQEENWRVRKGGERFWGDELVVPLRDEGSGRLLGFAKICRDLSERKAAEDELQRREARFRSLVENASDLITVLDAAGRVRFQSPSVERVLGHAPAELLGHRALDWVHPEDAARARAALRRVRRRPPATTPVECRFRHRNGTWVTLQSVGREFPMEDDGQLLVIHSRDVTSQKQLEAQLRQSQKMEAIGQLAGGVAHDFNNLLSVIFGHCERLTRALPPQNALSDSVAEIWRASERAASLTRKLLAFSRRQVLEPKVVDLNALVSEAKTLLERLIGEDVRLVTALRPELPPVRVDLSQIDQVILNLAVNARDAMPQGGTLTLETHEVQADAADAEIPPGGYVVLTVTDTGTGMTPEVQARVFEPFFTTKGEGKGTGLGLAVAHGIVEQSGGHLVVCSRPGIGTTFKVYLPAVHEPVARAAESAPLLPVQGCETVLLAEDEDPVRAITALILETLGYRVLQAASGEAALRMAEGCREKIDLLITDVVMPGMSGRALADALLARDPGLKVLFHSGYTDDAVVRRGVVQAEVAFLQKPFTPQALARKLREILDPT